MHKGYAQNESNDFDYENIWGVNKNTASGLIGGVIFRKGIRNASGSLTTYGLELINIKHPAELKFISGTGNSFIAGKVNHMFGIRGQYGRSYTLFKKAEHQGVQIDANIALGPSIALEAPYYIEYRQATRVPYDPSLHSVDDITGRGFIFQGLFQSSMVIGGNVKASLSFEFGSLNSSISGFEAGFLVDAYVRKINMMAAAENYAVWPTAFITLFYGSRK